MKLETLSPPLKFWAFVVFGLLLPLADVALDFISAFGLIKDGHSPWGWTIVCLEFVPSAFCLCVRVFLAQNIHWKSHSSQIF